MNNRKVRIFLTADDAGLGKNGNYSDAAGRNYSWDNTVPNSQLPQVGDLAVIRSKSHVIGVSMITNLTSEPSYKTRIRCSVCGSTKLRWSRSQRAFRCECLKVSEIPTLEYLENVDSYQANYEWFFSPLPDLTIEQVREISTKPKSIQSIQTAEFGPTLKLLSQPAFWKLGFIRVGGQVLRRELISLLSDFDSTRSSAEICEITGLSAPGQIIQAKVITYSVQENRFVISNKLNVLQSIAHCLQTGNCHYEEQTESLLVSYTTPNGKETFEYGTSKATPLAKQWLSNYLGLVLN